MPGKIHHSVVVLGRAGKLRNEAQKSINCLSARHELGLRCDDQNRETGGLTPSFYFN